MGRDGCKGWNKKTPAPGVVRWAGMGNLLGSSVANVKYISKDLNLIIIFAFLRCSFFNNLKSK